MGVWRRRLRIWLCLLLTVSMVLLALFRSRYTDTLCTLAETQVRNSTSDLINDAIDTQIESGYVQYDRIVYFEKDLNGKITALKTNMSEVNRLKTAILNRINDEILAMDSSQMGIPLGDLFLPEFLSDAGPQIPVHILSIRNSDAAFGSRFTNAGINQTLHQLTMEVSVDVAILVFGHTRIFTVSSQVVVAETIIVGQVPDTLLQTGGNYGNENQTG